MICGSFKPTPGYQLNYFPQILCPAGAEATPTTDSSALFGEQPRWPRFTPLPQGHGAAGNQHCPSQTCPVPLKAPSKPCPRACQTTSPSQIQFLPLLPFQCKGKKLSQSLENCFNPNKLFCQRSSVSARRGIQGSSTDIAYTS